MSQRLPPPWRVPVVPRPRHGELSASYLARVARANRTEWRTFAGLIGHLPSGLPADPKQSALTILTLNHAAHARLLVYTGLGSTQLTRAIPSLTPATFEEPDEPPAIRASTLRNRLLDCPECRLRRDGAFTDTRLFPLQMACLRHGYWLYRESAGYRLHSAILPEIAEAQRRLARTAARRGTTATARAYGIASAYLWEEWQPVGGPLWRSALVDRWYQRAEAVAPIPAQRTPSLPWWSVHPECAALAAVFASLYWAKRAIPTPDRRHRLFYQHMLTVLGVDGDGMRSMSSIRNFGSLPDDIRVNATWGRLISDPDYGALFPIGVPRRAIPFIDIREEREDLQTHRDQSLLSIGQRLLFPGAA